MCDECGCAAGSGHVEVHDAHGRIAHSHPGAEAVDVLTGILRQNDHEAAHNRAHFDQYGVLCVNLMSSPGSGKTSLLEATIEALGDRYRIGVIEGDLETENDAIRIREKGVPAIQITTGQTCHLDARMVHDALHGLALGDLDILFIENVGNLVCPAGFDLGQHANVALLSVTEGDDKPGKYPVIFRIADAVLLTKADLLPVLGDFSPTKAEEHVRALANAADVMTVSARQTESLTPWLDWLERLVATRRAVALERPAAAGSHHRHHEHATP
jgi:hydrogenase nickel incorporation protein HypB